MLDTANGEDSLKKGLKAISGLDLEPIKFKLMDTLDGSGWSRPRTEQASSNYRRFLILNLKFPSRAIVPSKDVDSFWHSHILDTKKYAADCHEIFGYFLHHFPYFGMRGEDDKCDMNTAFMETNDLYLSEFGVNLDDLLSISSRTASVCGHCGGDNDIGMTKLLNGSGIDFAYRPSCRDSFLNA
jgi:hypothetical protein